MSTTTTDVYKQNLYQTRTEYQEMYRKKALLEKQEDDSEVNQRCADFVNKISLHELEVMNNDIRHEISQRRSEEVKQKYTEWLAKRRSEKSSD